MQHGVEGDGFGGTTARKVDERPDHKALADITKAIHTLNRAILDVDRHDNRADEGGAAVDAWLRDIVGTAA